MKELRYYFIIAWFRFRENFTDLKATFVTYFLYAFFIWLLANLWMKFNAATSQFTYGNVILYVGITELLFMSFLSTRAIRQSTEDFSLSLARPRSWVMREIFANVGMALGKRVCFGITLVLVALFLKAWPDDGLGLLLRLFVVVLVMALPQALLSSLFSSLRLSHPQTDYMILPFSKIFLALGGVFGPLSDYGEPWRTWFLKLPGSDLFFQPAYYTIYGSFYETSVTMWILRFSVINFVLGGLLIYFFSTGRRQHQSWGG